MWLNSQKTGAFKSKRRGHSCLAPSPHTGRPTHPNPRKQSITYVASARDFSKIKYVTNIFSKLSVISVLSLPKIPNSSFPQLLENILSPQGRERRHLRQGSDTRRIHGGHSPPGHRKEGDKGHELTFCNQQNVHEPIPKASIQREYYEYTPAVLTWTRTSTPIYTRVHMCTRARTTRPFIKYMKAAAIGQFEELIL
jgi:hypothetical protein